MVPSQDRLLTGLIGNVFSGATLPYGMAKAVADVDSESNQGGFTTEGGNVTGFSTMHDSGTGMSRGVGCCEKRKEAHFVQVEALRSAILRSSLTHLVPAVM